MTVVRRRPTQQDPRLRYVPEGDVLAAYAARAALHGPADVMGLLRDHLRFSDDDGTAPTTRVWPPLRRASAGLRGLAVAEIRRAGVQDVASADHVLWSLVSKDHLSQLVDELKQRRGIDTVAEREAWRERRDAERLEQARHAIPGEDHLPFELTDSQRSYIARMRTGRDVTAVRIVAHDPHTQSVKVRTTYYRPAWRVSVSNTATRWVYATPQRAREARAQRASQDRFRSNPDGSVTLITERGGEHTYDPADLV